MRRPVILFLAIGLATLVAADARADFSPSFSGGTLPSSADYTVLAAVQTQLSHGADTFTMTEFVVQLNTGPNAGDLDFVLGVTANAGHIDNATMFTFNNDNIIGDFWDNTDTVTNGSISFSGVGGAIPTSGNAFDGVVTWEFGPTEIPQGSSSALLVLQTNTTNFTDGGVSVNDGGSINFDAFEPGPAPSSMILSGMGLLSVAGVVLVRRIRMPSVAAA